MRAPTLMPPGGPRHARDRHRRGRSDDRPRPRRRIRHRTAFRRATAGDGNRLALVYSDELLASWWEQTMGLLPPVQLFDAHTHIGVHDPDGFKCTAEELLATLAP